jgi:uncharacterized damage-inducible protein DinB
MPLNTSILSRLNSQHQTIWSLLQGLKPSEIGERVNPEKWSIHEHIAHLGRYQEIFLERVQLIRQGDTPAFARYSAETDTEFSAWQNADLTDILDQIKILRKEIYQLISHLSEDELIYIGIHPKYGLMNLNHWIEFFLLHEAHHLFSIFNLMAEIKQIRNA